jgi:two-component system cell cycle sensor histidine kinase/response regulator CckA
LLQAQKLESIGRLAGGVAHDFNNLLTAIIGNAGLMQMSLKPGDPQGEYIDQILAASNRAADLVRQLLTFARKQVIEPKRFNINETLTHTRVMLQRLLGEDIELAMLLDQGLMEVEMDPVQLEQIVLNLAVNARDAMPSGGQLLIETKNLFWNEAMTAHLTELRPGRCVMLAVSDTGSGIKQENLQNIFEPFFTTKEVGKGTGLGLATCYGIIKQANGHIEVQSELHHGTVFRIYLPAIIDEN